MSEKKQTNKPIFGRPFVELISLASCRSNPRPHTGRFAPFATGGSSYDDDGKDVPTGDDRWKITGVNKGEPPVEDTATEQRTMPHFAKNRSSTFFVFEAWPVLGVNKGERCI